MSSKGLGKYTYFSQDEIKDYLDEIKKLILSDRYFISVRDENDAFIDKYRIDTDKEKEILLNLQYIDFCYAVDNKKPEYSYEKLYVFCKEYELDNWGDLELANIYIKTNLTQTKSGSDLIIVISFHELNKPITYLFR